MYLHNGDLLRIDLNKLSKLEVELADDEVGERVGTYKGLTGESVKELLERLADVEY